MDKVMTSASLGRKAIPVRKKNDVPCTKCGALHASPVKRNGSTYKIHIDEDTYTCTPYITTCPNCKSEYEFDVAKRNKKNGRKNKSSGKTT